MQVDSKLLSGILDETYEYSRANAYKGYNKHDGLNSPILNSLLGWGRWPRMVAIQGVMRFPINLRTMLLTKKTYNPKGLALFSLGLLRRYEATSDEAYLLEAQNLLQLLEEIASPGQWSGIAWGYHYPWQDPGFFAKTNTPNAVVSCFVCEAFLKAYRLTGTDKYLEVVNSCIRFFLNDLTVLKSEEDQLCFGYMPLPMTMRVMDVSILVGTVIAQYVELSGENAELSDTAERLVAYVVNQQTAEGAWFYTDPPGDSHITHDNYHTGFILDALLRYMTATNNFKWQQIYDKGLKFYAERLFEPNGAPRWMHDKQYPYDIHGAAQGILTFSRHHKEYPEFAANIAQWAITNMYLGSGRFAYQQTRWFTKRFTLLRWCNAWMSLSIAEFLYQKVSE
ncbi:MAG: hypothetical protein ACR2PS_10050 [Pseudomonadales bacterium]